MDAEGTGSRRLTLAGNWNDEGAWSPDGSKIAFACRNEGDFNICVMDLATGQTIQVTSEGSNGHPTWSPDGQKIVVLVAAASGSTQIYSWTRTDRTSGSSRQGGNHSPAFLASVSGNARRGWGFRKRLCYTDF